MYFCVNCTTILSHLRRKSCGLSQRNFQTFSRKSAQGSSGFPLLFRVLFLHHCLVLKRWTLELLKSTFWMTLFYDKTLGALFLSLIIMKDFPPYLLNKLRIFLKESFTLLFCSCLFWTWIYEMSFESHISPYLSLSLFLTCWPSWGLLSGDRSRSLPSVTFLQVVLYFTIGILSC